MVHVLPSKSPNPGASQMNSYHFNIRARGRSRSVAGRASTPSNPQTTGLKLFRFKPIWKRLNRMRHYGSPGKLHRPYRQILTWMQKPSGKLTTIVGLSNPASAFASSDCGAEGCPNFSYWKLLITGELW